jgi:hypothetical protein
MVKLKIKRWAGYAARMRKKEAYVVLMGKPEGKRPLGKARRRYYIIKIYLREMGWGGVNWIDLAQGRDQ